MCSVGLVLKLFHNQQDDRNENDFFLTSFLPKREKKTGPRNPSPIPAYYKL